MLDMAEALLVHETLDADQVRRLAAGEAIAAPAQKPPPPAPPAAAEPEKETRPGIVPIPQRPLTQE
jgi:hypothetical protein